MAAALALGAAGALVGTRFQATAEALADPSVKQAIVEGLGEDTERSSVLDADLVVALAGQAEPPPPTVVRGDELWRCRESEWRRILFEVMGDGAGGPRYG